MKNNTLGNIAVHNTKRPRARFNLSSDVHTTMDFGSVIPAKCHLMIPNSKETVNTNYRVLCSPMLSPTMGRMSLKIYHDFVRMSDLFPNFAPMMAQETIARGTSSFTPVFVPHIPLNYLALMVLCGSYMNVYKSSTDDTTDTSLAQASVYSGTTGVIASDAILSDLGILTKNSSAFGTNFGVSSAFALNAGLLLGFSDSYPNNPYHSIPLGNPTNATFYPIDPTCDYYKANAAWYDLSGVSPQNADYVIPVTTTSDTYYLCFRLSDFGKRLRKILIGCGYQIDFTSTVQVSVLPLLAFFKAYFDVFGLTLYQNFEQTYCYRMLRSAETLADPDLSITFTDSISLTGSSNYAVFFYRFLVRELGLCYYTDEQDFVSAHTRSTAVSPSPQNFVGNIDTDVDSTYSYHANVSASTVNPAEPSSLAAPNGHSYINGILHGQLDSELLKRLYRWTNRNTIAGRRIAELLRAQGLGSYVDECKSDFIGSYELPIQVFDGVSGSDTFDVVSDSGAPLGERYGNGQAKGSSRTFTFECNEFGYWITLAVVVPKGGYCESIDPTVRAVTKFQYYNPEFDSLGMEFQPKSIVTGSMPFVDKTPTAGKLSDSFGLSPRYFGWKFGRNVANGDFTRRGVRSSFVSYFLDKIIDVGERLVRDESTSSSVKIFSLVKECTPSQLPIAGNVYRYPTRYPFIGRFNRIFNESFASREHRSIMNVGAQAEFEYFGTSDDNFIVHMIDNDSYFAPMLPVEDSFETYDDDNGVNGSSGKA